MTKDNSWLKKRNRGIHLTIRDIDCKDFDAEKMAQDFHNMGITFFSFFSGGYVTTYPSKLKYSRRSPWLGDRDITGDIVKAAHKYGIKAIAMADMSILPPYVAEEHPDWASVDVHGQPYKNPSGMYFACIMGGYGREYGREMVKEILDNYDVDGIKFGGGSYGFQADICCCEGCREDYDKTYHRPLPEKKDWNNPNWIDYQKWRIAKVTQRCRALYEMVKSYRPDMPVMGNGGCMGTLDSEAMANYQDMIQLEGQTRVLWSEDMSSEWVPVYWVPEEASYMTTVTDKPIWVVASYWKSRCWRRAAVEYSEQKPYMAQILANGASPMVNLSGGPPAVHEDQRGFRAFAELFSFMADHQEYYDGDFSGANVALVYSPESIVFYGREDPEKNYVQSFRGFERAMVENHIPYDVISTTSFNTVDLSRYKVLVLPTAACMSDGTGETIRNYAKNGGSVVATFETGLYDTYGNKRSDFVISDLFGAHYKGETSSVNGDDLRSDIQNYCMLTQEHDLLKGFEGTSVIPAGGRFCHVEVQSGTTVPLKLGAPFNVFPEGLSYTVETAAGHPMLIASELTGAGRCVYLPNQLDQLHYVVGMPDISQLLMNVVQWAVKGDLPAASDAPDTVYMTLRRQENRALLHLINFTGGQRYFKQLIPVHDIQVQVARHLLGGSNDIHVKLLSDGSSLQAKLENGYVTVTVPKLTDYDVVVFESR